MSDTGHKLELGQATDALADAIAAADPAALRKAAGDHATALNSQATAMAASIATPLYGRFDAVAAQIQELARIVANARQDDLNWRTNARQLDLNWRTEERVLRDAQSTRLYGELDKLIAASEESARGLGKLEQGQRDLSDRLDSKRLRIEALEADVATLKTWVAGLPTPEESRRLIALLEQLAVEHGNGT